MGTLIGSTFLDLKAASFNGTDERAYIDNPSFKADTQGAFAFWYRPTTVLSTTGARGLIGYGVRDAGNDSMWYISQQYNATSPSIAVPYRSSPIPTITTRQTNGGTTNRAYGNHIIIAGALMHYVYQSNGSAGEFYTNGTSVGATGWLSGLNNGDWLGDISGSDHRLTFASRFQSNVADLFSDATMNEAIYLNRPLTSGEITALYNGGTPRNPHRLGLGSALKSWWRFGDSRDDATTIYDEIGSNNLTLVNMDASNYITP